MMQFKGRRRNRGSSSHDAFTQKREMKEERTHCGEETHRISFLSQKLMRPKPCIVAYLFAS